MDQLSTLLGDLNGGIILTVSWLFYAVIGVVTVVAAVLLFGISRNLNVLIEIAYAIREEFNAARGTTKMQHNISNALREVEDLIYENASELRQTRKEMANLRDALAFKTKSGEDVGGGRPPAPQAPPRQIAPPAPQQAAPAQPAPQPAPQAVPQPAPQPAPQQVAPPPPPQSMPQGGAGYQRTDQPFSTFDSAFPAAAERSAARGKPAARRQPSRPAAPPEPEAEVIESSAAQNVPSSKPASRPQPAPPAQRAEAPPPPPSAPSREPEPKPPAPPPAARPPATPPRSVPAQPAAVPPTPERPRGPVPLGVRPQARPPAAPPSVPRAPAPPPPPPPPRPPAGGRGPGAGPGAGIVTTPDTKALRLASAERAAKAPPKRVVRVLNTTVNPPDVPAAGRTTEAVTTTPGPTTTAGPAEPVLRPPPEPEFTPQQRESGSRFQDKNEHNGAMSRLAALARKRDEERRGRPKGE